MWGCAPHWYALPTFLRNAIWKHYRSGQEVTKTPSPQYIAVAKCVQLWIEAKTTARIADGSEHGRLLNAAEIQVMNDRMRDEMLSLRVL